MCSLESLENYRLLENHFTTQILKKKKNNSLLGQISLPVVNRTGIYSHWSGSGDNIYNYSKLLKQNLFISLLLSLFFKKKFFIYNHIKKFNLYTHWEFMSLKSEEELSVNLGSDLAKNDLDKDSNSTCLEGSEENTEVALLENYAPVTEDSIIAFNKYVLQENAYYLNLTKLTSEKVALELPLYAGKILFLKQRGVLISLVFFFQPPKGEWKPKVKSRNYYKHTLTPIGNLLYQNDISYVTPLYYDKHVF